MPVTPTSPPGGHSRQSLARRSPFTAYLESLQSTGLRIILDEIRTDAFNFLGDGQGWTVSRDSRWNGGTETSFQDPVDLPFGSFQVATSGKAIDIIGRAPATPDLEASYRIDTGTKMALDISSPAVTTPESNSTDSFPYRRWASIPLPQDSKAHRVFVSQIPIGTTVDYAVVTVSDSAQVSTETAIMDDEDANLEWKGAWNQVKGDNLSQEITPYGIGVHEASEVGSEVKIRFIGSTISLYSFSAPSSLTVSFSMDGGSVQTRTYASQSSNQATVPNYLLYTAPGLSSSLHTLTVKLVENSSNGSLILDYITYTPAFASLATLASSGGDPSKYAAGSSQGQDGGSGGKTLSKATLAGTIVGVLVAVAVLVSCFCCQGKRHFARRVWRDWRKGGTKVKKERGSEKGLESEKTSADLARDDSPDWVFRNPESLKHDSRTSLERDLDLDVSPRARERRHQERDRARSRNKHRPSESRGESSRGHGGRESSRSRARPRASSGASAMGRKVDRAGTPPDANHVDLTLDAGPSTSKPKTLSEVALGKRPAREFAIDPVGYEGEGPGPSTSLTPLAANEGDIHTPQASGSEQAPSHHQEMEARRVAEAAAILTRMEGGLVALRSFKRNRQKDRRNVRGVRLMLDAIAAESWLAEKPDLQARVASLKLELRKEELLSSKLGAEHGANQRHRQRREHTTRELREVERKERERSRRDAEAHRALVEAYFAMDEGAEGRERKVDEAQGGSTRDTNSISSRRVRRPSRRLTKHGRTRKSMVEDEDVDWVDEDPISEANLITPYPISTNLVTPFTAMQSSSPAPRLKDAGEKMANTVTPFTVLEISPSSVSMAKDGKGGLKEGGIRPFMLMHPNPGTAPLSKKERSSHPPYKPAQHRKAKRQSFPNEPAAITIQTASAPSRTSGPLQSPVILQSQLSALIDEINDQHERGELPSPERLVEMVRLGRAIEESVEEMERTTGRAASPPPYCPSGDPEDYQRIGIAL